MADERFAEGNREPGTCGWCGSPIWRVYHGPKANQTNEPRLPVPDEAAIERGAKALAGEWPPCYCPDDWRAPCNAGICPAHDKSGKARAKWIASFRPKALAVLRAALDPDARPEIPEKEADRG